jgi:guanylate kinase
MKMMMNGGAQLNGVHHATAVAIGADATGGAAGKTLVAPAPPPAAPAPVATAVASVAQPSDELELIRTRSASLARPPLVICGPSGVGKGTLIGRLVADFPRHFGFSVSHTTRGPRPGEVDGVSYHFTTREAMEPMVAKGLFLEHAEVHGNMYGTSAAAVLDVCSGEAAAASAAAGVAATAAATAAPSSPSRHNAGRVCVLDIDVQGAAQLKRSPLGDKALFLFIAPPSLEELERRLRGRGTETEDRIARRLAGAKAELDKSAEPGFFDQVIVNDDLDGAYAALLRAVEARAPPGTLPGGAVADAEAKAEAGRQARRAQQQQQAAAAAAAAASAAVTAASTNPPATPAPASAPQQPEQQRPQQQQPQQQQSTRAYLKAADVDGALRDALLALAAERPAEPLRFLAQHLVGQADARQQQQKQ